MQGAESDAEKQAMRERIDALLRSQQDLESKTTSLQLTVDRLTLALAKTEEEEASFREKVSELSVSLNDSNMTTQGLQERMQQLQRALTNSEHDRKIMHERMEALKAAHQDGKNRNHMMAERVQQLQNEETESEVHVFTIIYFPSSRFSVPDRIICVRIVDTNVMLFIECVLPPKKHPLLC